MSDDKQPVIDHLQQEVYRLHEENVQLRREARGEGKYSAALMVGLVLGMIIIGLLIYISLIEI